LSQTDLDTNLLAGCFRNCSVGHSILHYSILDSTMDETRRLSFEGLEEGTIVIAEEQISGRGRYGRAWISPKGENLAFSVLLKPESAQLPFLNMAATLSVCKMISNSYNLDTTVKWPNDVRVNERKISGILVETDVQSKDVINAIIGVGINVNLNPSKFSDIATISTSIKNEIGQAAERSEVMNGFLRYFNHYYDLIRKGNSLTTEWSLKLDTLGSYVRVKWRNKIFEGRADQVDEQGNLEIIQTDGSVITVMAGEVTLQL